MSCKAKMLIKDMNQIRIREAAINKIMESTRTVNLIAVALDCSVFTVHRYLKANSDNLTKAVVLDVVKKELGLKDSEILEKVSKVA